MDRQSFDISIMNKMADLSKDMYPAITDLSTDITYIPKKTADFLGFDESYCKNFYEKLIDKINPEDIPEYKYEIDKRLRGIFPDAILYIRMGRDIKEYMMGFYMEVVYSDDGKKYMMLVLKNENAMQEIDPYTYLYGQAKFENDIEYYININRKVAIIEIEIVNITEFNILYGTNYSSAIERDLALRFISIMDENKAVYHMNNSKFVFILRDADQDAAQKFMSCIRDSVRDADIFKNFNFEFDMYSSGIILKDYDGETSTVISKLEYTLERAKETRTRDLLFFNDMVKINNEAHINLMKVIHESVLNDCDGFYVEYQPIVSSKDGRISGAEALVRWKKEPYGVVPPGLFIDWLEDTPAMYKLGSFVLRTAIKTARQFLDINPDFFISINASSEQLGRPEFGQEVLDTLKEFDFPPSHMWLEVTERCRDLPIQILRDTVTFIRNAGVRIAMDDYGTGSASSKLVLEIPVDEIKVDMSFIRDIQRDGMKHYMVKSIINFANDAGIDSCIEGVEDKALQDFLRSYGSTWFQGYYYSKPTDEESMKNLLK